MTNENRRKRRVEMARLYLSRQPQWIQDAINGDLKWVQGEICVEHQIERLFKIAPGHHKRLISAERAIKGWCPLRH